MLIYIYIYMYDNIYIYMYLYVYMYLYIYICMYMCIVFPFITETAGITHELIWWIKTLDINSNCKSNMKLSAMGIWNLESLLVSWLLVLTLLKHMLSSLGIIIPCMSIWWFPKMGLPQNGWFIMESHENPVNMDDMKICLKYHQLDILA